MSDDINNPKKYSELKSIYKYHIDSFTALYQLKTDNDDELNSIYKMIKTNLIDSQNISPKTIAKSILIIIPYNNRYAKSYLKLAKLITDEYQVKEVKPIPDISTYLFNKEYGIILNQSRYVKHFNTRNLDIHSENTIYRAIMYNDLEKFIFFTEQEEFDKNQKLSSQLYPIQAFSYNKYSLLELCCYHGAVDCFKLLRSKFNSEITQSCLELSFLGGNKEIMSECLKYQKPNYQCMKHAIISHNIDFVTFLMNEYNIDIDLEYCGFYNNLDAFLVYYDQTNDITKCFVYSSIFNTPSLCEYFLSLGANINAKDIFGSTALHKAARSNCKETVEFLISRGANINEKDNDEVTALHEAVLIDSLEIFKILLSHGANINESTALHLAVHDGSKEIVKLFISHGANVNLKDEKGETALVIATYLDNTELVELLLSHGSSVNYRDYCGHKCLINAVSYHNLEIVKLLLRYGANINEKDKYEDTALHQIAFYKSLFGDVETENKNKEIVEFLISHGANINEKDGRGRTPLQVASDENNKEIIDILVSHGANYQ
ncbi:ankyrin repeat protein, putative [Trichomonas vaginalis G3]|uniref:Ankyrin repeat protein, putative n=1 Tax=Trichomonas vaginalis (strain ATCC PRA-98 / G3) TaxID=412133 RepID=A2DJK1_TRIV3|nr:ankyrin repeat and SOCS box-containing protein 4 family [Trichomonas vaginalis G3]EAY19401.1 ankyrin repeat protein, putative [Trichomonas vaginalis G3]KAI5493201.1 ankyrin repeat and SOCS box-containing protein 4 family [Trichomonas vaginalis G3]|eukprot:XP_001580387.1 ankyrin repeat protein [Trichomonas vaginalis G3]